MVKLIKEQHSYSAKRKDDDREKKKGKTFQDIGGCEKAKEAVR